MDWSVLRYDRVASVVIDDDCDDCDAAVECSLEDFDADDGGHNNDDAIL